VELNDTRKLGIATFGALKQHPRISAFRQFIEGWYLSYFTPDAARSLPLAGPQKHLNIHGDNISNVVAFMEREHPKQFERILADIAEKIPGVEQISTERMPDGRLLLKFNDKGFHEAFSAQQMSDGTLKVFAYLLMLSDPTPPPFICIEEPENGLYHKLLETLAKQFRTYVTDKKQKSQIFITTHQPYFIDALEPNEVWILEKGDDGFSRIHRASENSTIQGLVDEGLPLGGLWYSDYLEGV
jgi:predicted ATPase